MQKTNNLQDRFLLRARKTRAHVTVFLINGYQLRGVIAGYDAFVVVLMSEGKQQVIYKHAISTITPERAVDLSEDEASPAPQAGRSRRKARRTDGRAKAEGPCGAASVCRSRPPYGPGPRRETSLHKQGTSL